MLWYCDDEIAGTVQTGHFPEDSDPKVVLEALIPYVKSEPTLTFEKCSSKYCDSAMPNSSKVCFEFSFNNLCFGTLWYYKEAEYQQMYGLEELNISALFDELFRGK